MNSISPNPGASIITEKTYKAQFQPAKDEGGGVNKTESQKVDSVPSAQAAVVTDGPLVNTPRNIDPKEINELISKLYALLPHLSRLIDVLKREPYEDAVNK